MAVRRPHVASRWIAATSATLVLWGPQLAAACSVCTSGREEETQLAFILTTAFLSFLPLGLVGGVVWWLVHRVRALEARSAAAVAAAGSSAGASARL